jgi:hypothetical protein
MKQKGTTFVAQQFNAQLSAVHHSVHNVVFVLSHDVKVVNLECDFA